MCVYTLLLVISSVFFNNSPIQTMWWLWVESVSATLMYARASSYARARAAVKHVRMRTGFAVFDDIAVCVYTFAFTIETSDVHCTTEYTQY